MSQWLTNRKMPASPANEYIAIFANNEKVRLGLLACSAALRLDDEIAREIIHLAAQSNGSTDNILIFIKSLDCVWEEWDGTWCITSDVRLGLLEHFYNDVPDTVRAQLRDRLARYSEQQAEKFPPDGQITAYRRRRAEFETAYQRTMIPEQSTSGLKQLVELWKTVSLVSPSAARATAESIDYLAPEIERHFSRMPVEVLFFQGMAARARKDDRSQRRYFGEVWSRGRPGDIFAEAAHYYGLLERDLELAERALNDSMLWDDSTSNRIRVKNSLGKRLSEDRHRWRDAEEAFRESIELDPDPVSQAYTRHSLGQLLGKDRQRWDDAEKELNLSLELRDKQLDRAKTLHSLGKLLAKNPKRRKDAEDAYRRSLEIHEDKPYVLHSIGNLLSLDEDRWPDAEDAYKKSLSIDRDEHSKAKTWHSLGNLLSKDPTRAAEAENAYRRSLQLDNVSYSRGQTWHSLGKLLSQNPQRWKDAKIALEESLRLRDNEADKALTRSSLAQLLSKFDNA
jgi:tetratricopeptide (TPR) repeat protein